MRTSATTIYHILFSHFGPQHWWPMDKTYHIKNRSDPRFEVIIGAILTQNTAWTNVEKAIACLKKHHLLNSKDITKNDSNLIGKLIRPSGYFNQKAKRLQTISTFLEDTFDGDLDWFFSQSIQMIRNQLLSLQGIGPETADSILLYAGMKPVFVVDTYTKRLCHRLELPVDQQSYDDIQQYFQKDLSKNHNETHLVTIFNECHAVIVEWAKTYCRKRKPQCHICPLNSVCSFKENMKSKQF